MKLQNSPKNGHFAEPLQSSIYTVLENESVFTDKLCECKEKTRYHSISCDFMLPQVSFKLPQTTVISFYDYILICKLLTYLVELVL